MMMMMLMLGGEDDEVMEDGPNKRHTKRMKEGKNILSRLHIGCLI